MSTGRSIHAVPSITPSPREGIEDGPRLLANPLDWSNWQMTQETAHPCQPAAQANQPSLSTMAGFARGAPIRNLLGYPAEDAARWQARQAAEDAVNGSARPSRDRRLGGSPNATKGPQRGCKGNLTPVLSSISPRSRACSSDRWISPLVRGLSRPRCTTSMTERSSAL